MTFTLRYSTVSDILRVVVDSACDDSKTMRLKRMNVLGFPKQIVCDKDMDSYLMHIQGQTREDSAFEHFYFFAKGYLFEVHKVGYFQNKYSFIQFPPSHEEFRHVVQQLFSSAVLKTESSLGWFQGKWEDLTDEQRTLYTPVFVEDDVEPPLM